MNAAVRPSCVATAYRRVSSSQPHEVTAASATTKPVDAVVARHIPQVVENLLLGGAEPGPVAALRVGERVAVAGHDASGAGKVLWNHVPPSSGVASRIVTSSKQCRSSSIAAATRRSPHRRRRS
jgi:hypothetical protein